jgi:hypothetical protein
MGTGGFGVLGGGGQCGDLTVPLQLRPPDVLIIQDRSLSMEDNSVGQSCPGGCGTSSKWSQVSTAIEQVVTATGSTVNWGLKLFGSDNACGVTPGATVSVASGNDAAIQAAFASASPGGDTPTESALDSAVTYMQSLTDSNPKYLLLATDGLPNCTPGDAATADDSSGAEAAITRARTAGFDTFVVGIATAGAATATLDQMALNGGVPQPGGASSYYAVSDTTSLETALTTISDLVQCTLAVPSTVGGANLGISVKTSSGNLKLLQDPTNGWSLSGDKQSVVLNGTACANLTNGTYQSVLFVYTCPGG